MRWGILGPLRVADDAGTEIRLPAGRLRVLLAGLLTQANHVVPVDELVELVWDGAPPVRAARTVRVHVVRLRRALGPSAAARIVTEPPGYLCRAEEDELDVLRFEKLCRQARSAAEEPAWPRAAALLTEALGLWRGAPLADVPSDLLRQRELPRLDRLRVQAIDDQVDAGMHLGRHEQLVPQLHDLIARYPLRERPPAQLMRVLARAGRRGEALEVYQDARRVLASELGIEPGPELRGLHERILAGDAEPAPPADAVPASTAVATPAPGQLATTPDAPALATPAPSEPARVVPRELPMGVGDFTGRPGELRALTRLLDESGDRVPGAPLISAIGGTAGVGKSALAVHWAHQAASRFPDGQLYLNLRGFDPSGKPVPPEQAVRTLLGALQVPAGQIPAGVDAQAGLYRSLLSGKRMLVVLDNARDAEQVRLLLPGSPGCMVLVTSRRQLSGLVAAENAHYLPLDLLSDTEARELLSRRLGPARLDAAPQAAADLIGMCARLPLALAIAAARISARPQLSLDTFAEELRDVRSRLDTLDTGEAASSIRTVFSWSAGTLSAPAARLFALLSLHPGPDITIPAAASLAGTPAAQVRRALDELAEAHLITEHTHARFAMHDLLQAYATEQVAAYDTAAQRTALHSLLDYYLHTSRAANLALYPARGQLTLAPPQPDIALPAFTGPEQAQAWMEAERHVLIAATAQAAAYRFDSHTWQIAYYLAVFLDLHDYWAEWAATQQTALVCAQRLGDRVAQARIHLITSHIDVRLGSCHDAEIRLSSALRLYQQVQDEIGQARVHVAFSLVLNHQGKHGDALGHAHEALILYRSAGHQAGLATALNAVGWSEAHLDHPQRAVATCMEAIDLHRETGNRLGEAEGWDSLGYAYHRLGDHRQAIGCYERAIDRHQELAALYQEADVWTRMGDVHLASGHPERARLSWERALANFTEKHHPDAERVRRRLQHLDSVADGDLGERSDPGAEPLFQPVNLAAPGILPAVPLSAVASRHDWFAIRDRAVTARHHSTATR